VKLRDQWSGLFWLLFSGLVCIASVRMGPGSFRSPGPGLLPLLAGGVVGLLSLLLMVTGTLKKERGGGSVKELWTGASWKKVVVVSASLLLYAAFLARLGFLIATFVLMTLLFGILGKWRLWVRAIAAIVTVLAVYIVFHVFLDLQLPQGLLGL
jgi:putative tricarboxylic transport membrane protein